MSQTAMSPAEFEQALRAKGAYYHTEHPFHRAMYAGTARVDGETAACAEILCAAARE